MRRTFLSLCLAALLAAFASAPAAAATLRIDTTDLDLKFENGSLFTGTDDSLVDPLSTMDFFLDDVKIGSLTSNIFAFVGIFGVDPVPTTGGPVKAAGGQVTLLTNDEFTEGVAFDLNDISLNFIPFGSSTNPRMALNGVASASVFAQIGLPFAEFDPSEPIDVLFVLNLSNIKTLEGYIQSFDAVGTGSVQGEGNVVPEPTSMLLLGTGLLGAARMRRRALAKQQENEQV